MKCSVAVLVLTVLVASSAVADDDTKVSSVTNTTRATSKLRAECVVSTRVEYESQLSLVSGSSVGIDDWESGRTVTEDFKDIDKFNYSGDELKMTVYVRHNGPGA